MTNGAFTNILGVHVSAIDLPQAVDTIEQWVEADDTNYVCVFTVHSIMECQDDPGLMDVANNAGLCTPDGMPLVWLSKRAGHSNVSRVYGPDLMLELAARSATTGHQHFFYGGAPGVAEDLATSLVSKFPGLLVAGTYEPGTISVGAIETPQTIEAINATDADIVWVGLGTPKQDWWVANHRRLLNAPVLIAVGAAFDFHTGRVRQAPGWMQRHGLEWLFRLSQDPKRLWKRYLVGNVRFTWQLVTRVFAGLKLRMIIV